MGCFTWLGSLRRAMTEAAHQDNAPPPAQLIPLADLAMRSERSTTSTTLRFELALAGRDSTSSRTSHDVYITNADPDHGGQSTFAAGLLDLPSHMQGKGVAAVYFAAAAQAAHELGVEIMVAENVVSPAMEALCVKLGMRPARFSSYGLEPAALYQNAMARCALKGWN